MANLIYPEFPLVSTIYVHNVVIWVIHSRGWENENCENKYVCFIIYYTKWTYNLIINYSESPILNEFEYIPVSEHTAQHWVRSFSFPKPFIERKLVFNVNFKCTSLQQPTDRPNRLYISDCMKLDREHHLF